MLRVALNFLLFQVGWFACVLGGAQGMPWLGVAVVVAIVAYHLSASYGPWEEAALLSLAAVVGTVFDSALVMTGWLDYPSGQLHPALAPYWIVAMWALFATTINVSLRWLRSRLALAALFGGIGGPLAYYAGAKLGGVGLADPTMGLSALAVGWALIMPLLMVLAKRLDGWSDAVGARERASQGEPCSDV